MIITGIYRITLADGRCYVGSSVNVAKRWREHRRKLTRGVHHSKYLQHAWTKHGEAAFTFEVLEGCSAGELVLREQHWMDRLDTVFNTLPAAGSALGFRQSSETRARISAAQRGKPKPPGFGEKIRAAKLGNEYGRANAGRVLTAEHRAKLSAAHKGKVLSPEHRAKVGAAFKGRSIGPHSAETRAKISATKTGTPLSPEHRAAIRAGHARRRAQAETPSI